MAKELPYFKFEPSQWENGTIQLCTFEEQGVFIAVCSMYWQRVGDLPYKLAVQKICRGNATALDSLSEQGIFAVVDGMICIDFLNEQLAEFNNVSAVNAENARLGWEKRRNKATAKRPQSEPNAIREEKRREEEIRVDEKKEDFIIYGEKKLFQISIKAKYTTERPVIIYDLKKYFEGTAQLEALILKKWDRFDDFMKENPANVFEDATHLYNSFRNFHTKTTVKNGKNTNSASTTTGGYAGKL